jgi:hypothetical protein
MTKVYLDDCPVCGCKPSFRFPYIDTVIICCEKCLEDTHVEARSDLPPHMVDLVALAKNLWNGLSRNPQEAA